ncbi:MAG: DNA translocase FtsK [Gammaproteobacteria bacterium]
MKDKILTSHLNQRIREAMFLCVIGLSIFLLLAFASYSSTDPSWSHATHLAVRNMAGKIGAMTADITLFTFGYMAYVFPFLLMLIAWFGLIQPSEDAAEKHEYQSLTRVLGFLLLMTSASALASIYFKNWHAHLPASSGGVVGDLISHRLLLVLNQDGATILLSVLFFAGVTLFLGVSWVGCSEILTRAISRGAMKLSRQMMLGLKALGRGILKLFQSMFASLKQLPSKIKFKKAPVAPRFAAPPREPVLTQSAAAEVMSPVSYVAPSPTVASAPVKKPKKVKIKKPSPSAEKKLEAISSTSTELLNAPKVSMQQNYTQADLEHMSKEVEQRLLDFNIEVNVVSVNAGPVVTRFELMLAPGVKASRISGLATDLARSLSVVRVRVVEVIPGKSTVGLELPNKHREVVYLREVLESAEYLQASSPLSLALGKDIAGQVVVVDLAKMPHLLVAGTTGSGKSVGLNAMLLSLLFKSTPEEVRMILVDPKMLELSIYEGVPHLLTPVVTDMKEAANALRWCVAEMERRYRLLASQGVRSLDAFNQKVKKAKEKGDPIPAPSWYQGDEEEQKYLETLPLIVVVIDEFADMMMVVGKKVEQLIARIAQKARAAGIHLILATQRPSVNVITGLIKANIPTRIAFQVSSKIDSRTILDQQGAQQLLGHGDMLYLAPGTGVPKRVHGAFVADDEVHRVVAEWKQCETPDYIDFSVDVSGGDGDGDGEQGGEQDALYDQAVQVVLETRRVSISSLQRRFKIGYNRAARLVDDMEAAGLVGPMESNGSREILVPEGR